MNAMSGFRYAAIDEPRSSNGTYSLSLHQLTAVEDLAVHNQPKPARSPTGDYADDSGICRTAGGLQETLVYES